MRSACPAGSVPNPLPWTPETSAVPSAGAATLPKVCQAVGWFPSKNHFKQKLVVGHCDDIAELYFNHICVLPCRQSCVKSLLFPVPPEQDSYLNIAMQYFNRKKYEET